MTAAAPRHLSGRLAPLARGLALRVGGALAVLGIVATATFAVLRLLPGDPAEAALGGPGSQASAEALAAVRAEFGLDRPVIEQYGAYLARLVTGDLGVSYSQRVPVTEVIGELLGPTLLLAVCALVVGWLLALAGALLATGRSRLVARGVEAAEVGAAVLPGFWLASMLVLVVAGMLGWLPAVGGGAAGLVLPTLALAIPLSGFLGQVMREGMLRALAAPFALAARARGESVLGLRVRHALRHGLVPGVELSGWAFGYLVSGAVVVETVFARPGLGRALLSAVTQRDVPLVLGVTLVSALGYVLITLVADALVRAIDPRSAS